MGENGRGGSGGQDFTIVKLPIWGEGESFNFSTMENVEGEKISKNPPWQNYFPRELFEDCPKCSQLFKIPGFLDKLSIYNIMNIYSLATLLYYFPLSMIIVAM
jgi:hypothetical protein